MHLKGSAAHNSAMALVGKPIRSVLAKGHLSDEAAQTRSGVGTPPLFAHAMGNARHLVMRGLEQSAITARPAGSFGKSPPPRAAQSGAPRALLAPWRGRCVGCRPVDSTWVISFGFGPTLIREKTETETTTGAAPCPGRTERLFSPKAAKCAQLCSVQWPETVFPRFSRDSSNHPTTEKLAPTSMTPAVRTISLFRRFGWIGAAVARWIVPIGRRQDVWGFGDILGRRSPEPCRFVCPGHVGGPFGQPPGQGPGQAGAPDLASGRWVISGMGLDPAWKALAGQDRGCASRGDLSGARNQRSLCLSSIAERTGGAGFHGLS
jgi:hypothetical protein